MPWLRMGDEARILDAFVAVARKRSEDENLTGPRRTFECKGFTAGEMVI
jgi:hypothetical protein